MFYDNQELDTHTLHNTLVLQCEPCMEYLKRDYFWSSIEENLFSANHRNKMLIQNGTMAQVVKVGELMEGVWN